MADRQVRRRLSEEEMNRGIGMLEAGLSQREVARVLGGVPECCLKNVDAIPFDWKRNASARPKS